MKHTARLMAPVMCWSFLAPSAFANIQARRVAASRRAVPTQTPDAAQRKLIAEAEAKRSRVPDVRELGAKMLEGIRVQGRVNLTAKRNQDLCGMMPWQRDIHGMNLCTGNLTKVYTDIQVKAAKGPGLSMVRTYNSNDEDGIDDYGNASSPDWIDARPFGIGWSHAYEIAIVKPAPGSNDVSRTDFFGGRHSYHRDADGLYTPPAYLYDSMTSVYGADGEQAKETTQTGQDGSVKHYVNDPSDPTGCRQVIDYMADRHDNRVTFAYSEWDWSGNRVTRDSYGAVTSGAVTYPTRLQLDTATDASGRQITFRWANVNPAQPTQPRWRVTQVYGPVDTVEDGGYNYTEPLYVVQYSYTGGYLTSVTQDPSTWIPAGSNTVTNRHGTHTPRITTFKYWNDGSQSFAEAPNERGLLRAVTEPLGYGSDDPRNHTTTYEYTLAFETPKYGYPATVNDTHPTPTEGDYGATVWVKSVAESSSKPTALSNSGDAITDDGDTNVWTIRYLTPKDSEGWSQGYRHPFDSSSDEGFYLVCENTSGDGAAGASFVTYVDSRLRAWTTIALCNAHEIYDPDGDKVTGAHNAFGPSVVCDYDTANNVRYAFKHTWLTDGTGHAPANDSWQETETYSQYDPLTGGLLATASGTQLPIPSSGNRGDGDYVNYALAASTYAHGTRYTYYGADRYYQKASETDPLNRTTAYDYFAIGADLTSSGNVGELKKVTTPDSKEFTTTYNDDGQKDSETVPKVLNGGTTATNVTTTYDYRDTWGNLTHVFQDPSGVNRTTMMAYDAAGRVTSVTDPKGRISANAYNGVGQLTRVDIPANVDDAQNTVAQPERIRYAYDLDGATTDVKVWRGSSIDESQTPYRQTKIIYEPGCGRVRRVYESVPGSAAWMATAHAYLASGEVAYAETYRVQGDGSVPGQFTELANTKADTRSCAYDYAPANFASVGDATLPPSIVMSKDDPNSISLKLARITDNANRVVDYVLDGWGRIQQARFDQTLTGAAVTSCCTTTYSYGFRTQGNGVVSGNQTNDYLAQVSTTWDTLVGGALTPQRILSRNSYTYDDAGNRVTNRSHIERVVSTDPIDRWEGYKYDEQNRLKEVYVVDGVKNDDTFPASPTQSYTFDPVGNRLTKTDTQTGAETYQYDGGSGLKNWTAGGVTRSNYLDMAGNTTQSGYQAAASPSRTNDTFIVGSRKMTWDGQNRLVECRYRTVNGDKVTLNDYGADGLRRHTAEYAISGVDAHGNGGTLATTPTESSDFLLDGQSVVRSFGSTSSNDRAYGIGLRGVEYEVAGELSTLNGNTVDGTVQWFVYDGLGSAVGTVNESGMYTSLRKYDVYGKATDLMADTSGTKHKFVGSLGHTTEDDSGLIYMRARYMDPEVGRFVSEDPEGDGNNWFTYCRNNPVNMLDSSGKNPVLIALIAVAIIGILAGLDSLTSDIPMSPRARHVIRGITNIAQAIGVFIGAVSLFFVCLAALCSTAGGFGVPLFGIIVSLGGILCCGQWLDKGTEEFWVGVTGKNSDRYKADTL
jgi:RHS repeat-associated protein